MLATRGNVALFLAGSGFFLFLAIWISTDRLSALGLMEISLSSPIPLVRETALLEIRLAKAAFVAVAAILCALAIAMPWVVKTRWFHQVQVEYGGFPAQYEQHQQRFFTVTTLAALATVLMGGAYLRYGEDIFSAMTRLAINREDGVLEMLSAALLLAASGLALRVARGAGWSAVGVFHGFLGLLFFLMFGEEISWGQRILGFETPEALEGLNVQNEVNLHNMFGYLFDHLFILLFFLWGCVVPALYWAFRPWRWLQSRVGFPFPSAGLAVAMLLVTLTQNQITDPLIGRIPGLRVAELRELLSAMCFLLMMVESQRLSASHET